MKKALHWQFWLCRAGRGASLVPEAVDHFFEVVSSSYKASATLGAHLKVENEIFDLSKMLITSMEL